MRSGAAIIVAIGVCFAALILFERRMGGDIYRVDDLVAQAIKAGSVTVETEQLEQELQAMWICRIAVWIMEIVGVLFLGLIFFKVSQRKVRSNFTEPLPDDDFALIHRLSQRDQYHFQYGILTLLALTLAVALVCLAIVYSLR